MKPKIPPTRGRIVWYSDNYGVERPAWIAMAHGDDGIVNLLVLNEDVGTERALFVEYWDGFDEQGRALPLAEYIASRPPRFWSWMDYQRGQSNLQDKLEGRLAMLEDQMSRIAAKLDRGSIAGVPEQPR